jgi:ribonuclease J
MKIFFVPNTYTGKMAEDKRLYKFKSAKITFEEIQSMRNKLVIKDTYLTRTIFGKKKALTDTSLIYSMWEGYLDDVKLFWEKHEVPIIKVHSSGHAYIEELKSFVGAVKPKYIIPNHTFYPEKYLELLGSNVMLLKDKQPVVL